MFSNLFRVTKEMAGCNGFAIKPIEQWPELPSMFDLEELEQQAAKLDEETTLIFVDGETSEVASVNEALELSQLNTFLNEVFDGELHGQIAI